MTLWLGPKSPRVRGGWRLLICLALVWLCVACGRDSSGAGAEETGSDSGSDERDFCVDRGFTNETLFASTTPINRLRSARDAIGGTDGVFFELCDEPIEDLIDRDHLAVLGPDTDSYRPLSDEVRTGVGNALYAIIEGETESAQQHAQDANYRLCSDGTERVLLAPRARGTGHAAVVLDLSDEAVPLILEAPHPLFDTGTLEESVALLQATRARALIVSGTHRCASYRESGCHGTANACGFLAPVRESDMAHATDSVFHTAHIALTTALPETWVISLHGFGGPGLSVSNGTTDPADMDSRLARFATALSNRFADVTTCNEFGDGDVPRAVRLCGTTNVQGRHLNGSPWECTKHAFDAADRFLHLEQSSIIRHEDSDAIAEAILEALNG